MYVRHQFDVLFNGLRSRAEHTFGAEHIVPNFKGAEVRIPQVNPKRLFQGKAIFDDTENLCNNVNATFSSPDSYEAMQSVLQQSNDTIIKIWTPMIKISTTEYTDGDRDSWTLQTL